MVKESKKVRIRSQYCGGVETELLCWRSLFIQCLSSWKKYILYANISIIICDVFAGEIKIFCLWLYVPLSVIAAVHHFIPMHQNDHEIFRLNACSTRAENQTISNQNLLDVRLNRDVPVTPAGDMDIYLKYLNLERLLKTCISKSWWKAWKGLKTDDRRKDSLEMSNLTCSTAALIGCQRSSSISGSWTYKRNYLVFSPQFIFS